MTSLERALKYADATPPAVAGAGGHNQTFSLACALVHGFCLSDGEVLSVLQHHNAKCQPPWSERELIHKVKQAFSASSSKPAGYLLDDNRVHQIQKLNGALAVEKKPVIDPATAIENFLNGHRSTPDDLSGASPILLEDDFTKDGILLLSHLFRPGEKVNFVVNFKLYQPKSGSPKANPEGIGTTSDRDTLISWWRAKGMPKSEAGGWMRINPVDGGVNDENVTAFRYALVEFDRVPLDLQLSFAARVPLPIAAILTSGGKSIHLWVKIDAPDFPSYEASVSVMRDVLTRYGIDRVNKNPSRLSRLVGVTRVIGAASDPRQRLIFLNPNPKQEAIL